MNIIPEKKYGKIGCHNNMDILIKINVNSSLFKKNNNHKIINIIFDNSISSIGECFFKLKNGIKKFVSLIPSDYKISIYSNQNIIYSGNNKIINIFNKVNQVECQGFNNYQKYIDLKLENCILFTDEYIEESNDFLKVISVDNCLDLSYLNTIIASICNNIGNGILKLYPINNSFIKKVYNYDYNDKIKISNFTKNTEYNILINMDFISFDSNGKDIIEADLFLDNKSVIKKKFKILFVKENNLVNNEVLIQRILHQGNLLEKTIKTLYKQRDLNKIKMILYKLKEIYNFGENPELNKKYRKVTDCILYLEEELNSESLKSLELNYEMKYNHFDLNR